MGALTVVVADDHALTLSGVADSLNALGIKVVGRAQSAPEAAALVRSEKPDVLMTDLNMGAGPTGIDIAHVLRREMPLLGIVVLSSYGDPRLLSEGLGDPPRGLVYVVKQQVESTGELSEAITIALERARAEAAGELPRINLTDTQIEVLRLLAQGLSNFAIAEELSVAENSVAKTINRMLRRMSLESDTLKNPRAQLLHFYFDLTGSRS